MVISCEKAKLKNDVVILDIIVLDIKYNMYLGLKI